MGGGGAGWEAGEGWDAVAGWHEGAVWGLGMAAGFMGWFDDGGLVDQHGVLAWEPRRGQGRWVDGMQYVGEASLEGVGGGGPRELQDIRVENMI